VDRKKSRFRVSFKKALAGFVKPDFMRKAKTPWEIADQLIWGPRRWPLTINHGCDESFIRCQQKISLTKQLIHGDMTGNILFSESFTAGGD